MNNFFEKFYCSNFSKVTAKTTKLVKFLRKMLPKNFVAQNFVKLGGLVPHFLRTM